MSKPILVIAKKSIYEVYGLERREPHFLQLLRSDNELAKDLMAANEDNRRAVEAVTGFLTKEGLSWEFGAYYGSVVDGHYSMVVSVGGDGTLLAASHRVGTTPILGINSRPGVSVGFFCPVSWSNFQSMFRDILSGKHPASSLMRMEALINGTRVGPPSLNDLLFSARSPACMTVYRMEFEGREELQKSAGIWISTPAGSTAAIMAAGGQGMELWERRMQFLVRECYCVRDIRGPLRSGMFERGLKITNLTPEASVFVDGSRMIHNLNYGDVVEPVIAQEPLSIYLKR